MKARFNSSIIALRAANAAFAAETPEGALVLDAGAGDAPYRDLFSHTRYETADLQTVEKTYADLTYACDLADIPVEDARFDRIVCNQVMEHVPDPRRILTEFHRVLKPGGRMILSAPLMYEEHEIPFDFYRYTQFAWGHLLPETGFEIEKIERVEGVFGALGYHLWRAGKALPLAHRKLMTPAGIAAWPVIAFFKLFARIGAAIFSRLELVAKIDDRGAPLNYLVIARKPGGTGA